MLWPLAAVALLLAWGSALGPGLRRAKGWGTCALATVGVVTSLVHLAAG
ncbi:hypothetical protein [Streptomyces sp. NPDC057702]